MKTDPGPLRYERIKGHPISRPSMKITTLCPICRYAVIDAWDYCPHCGSPLVPVIKKTTIKDSTA